MDFTRHWAGFIALAIFFLAYSLVIAEEYLHLRKSKPVIVAAGVAVMGQARGIYTFFSHLKWSWAILLGYAASVWVHFLVNADKFTPVASALPAHP
jgi:hypothetical protein